MGQRLLPDHKLGRHNRGTARRRDRETIVRTSALHGLLERRSRLLHLRLLLYLIVIGGIAEHLYI